MAAPAAIPGSKLPARSRRGRPRDAGADEAIRAATIELLGGSGIGGLSMDLLAKRAGVSKATIYRRWASKEELVLEALGTAPPSVPTPDTGSVHGDLVTYTTSLAEKIRAAPHTDVLPHLIEAAVFDERLRASLHDYIRGRQAPVRTILRRAVERGELADADDVEVIVDLLIGPFLYRRLMTGAPITKRYAARLVDFVLGRAT